MRKKILFSLALAVLGIHVGAQTKAIVPVPSVRPNAYQRAQIDQKYGMFVHFGMNTFHDQEWTDGSKPASTYAPSAIE
ncbi:crotonobetainyl-CoA--carnitine CoA-transferase, partial [Sphingobacterium multivorum]